MRKTILLALSLVCLTMLEPASAQMQAQLADRIFYSSFRPENADIYLSTDHGRSFTPFTDHAALEYNPVITPDGQYVVFTSEQVGHPQLYIKSINGNETPRRLVCSHSMQDQASISPDGRWILFVSSHEGNADIYRLPFQPDTCWDIASAENLTQHPGGDFRPSYSPDGRLITFCSDRAHPIKSHPRFSFARARTGNIFSMDTSGQQIRQLTLGKEWDGSPVWSKDGSRIFYYSMTDEVPDLWSMDPDGTGHEQITPTGTRALSPCVLSDGKIGFTSWRRHEEGSFRLLTYDMGTKQIDTLFHSNINMFHLQAHPNGTLVFHGGKEPEETEMNKGGFHGSLLIQNQPFTDSIDGKVVHTFGVRRAFVAPAYPHSPHLIIDSMDLQGISDAFTPWLLALLAYPIYTLILLVISVIQRFRHRTAMSVKNLLLVSALAVLTMIGILGLCFYGFMVLRMPLHQIRWIMTGLSVFLALMAWLQFRKMQKKKTLGLETYRVNRFNTGIFSAGAVVALYLAGSLHLLLHLQIQFSKVNYVTREVTPLFRFTPDANLNPSFSQFLDGRVHQQGHSFLFTIGGFGAGAHHQGDIWSYDFDRQAMERLAHSKDNDGFADMSEDGQSMVFRSGRGGMFDLYVQEEGEIRQVTQDSFKENFPSISPQGDKIVYASDKEGADALGGPRTFDLFLLERMSAGVWSEPRRLTNGNGQNAHPSFSPDGEWIIYTTEAYGIMDEQALIQTYFFSPQMYGEIVAMRLRDGHTVRLTHNMWEEGAPQWVGGI